MDATQILNTTIDTVTRVGLRALGALALWIIGRWLIAFCLGLISRSMTSHKVDPTLTTYIRSTASVLLNIALVTSILGYFGVNVTTFAALVAAGGVAIGVAWGGMLSNFAAGAFLVVLRPFKVGDFVTAGGVTGTVREIGMFVTSIDTPDNVRSMVGNGKIFSDTIQNFSTNAHRRVDLIAQLHAHADHSAAIELLREKIAKIPNVLKDPAPQVEILEHKLAGPLLAVRPFTHNDNYWQVYFDTNRVIRESLSEAGFAAPLPVYGVKQV